MSYGFMWEEEAIVSLLLTLLGGIPSGVFGIICYVLSSMALYVIAQRREIRKAWLAWVPVLNCWILGSLSDQYRYVVKGQFKSKRKWLLGLNILNWILGSIVLGFATGALINAFRFGDYAQPFLDSLLGMVGVAVPIAVIGAAIKVLQFMALYDVYVSLDPDNAVLFLVLSILIPIVEPFFLFFNREKDTGMPPRRQPQQQPAWEQENKDYL